MFKHLNGMNWLGVSPSSLNIWSSRWPRRRHFAKSLLKLDSDVYKGGIFFTEFFRSVFSKMKCMLCSCSLTLSHCCLYSVLGTFRELVDINFVSAMGPPGGGRNPVTPRFLRHFNHLSFTELEDDSKHRIFATILTSWLGRALYIQHCVRFWYNGR